MLLSKFSDYTTNQRTGKLFRFPNSSEESFKFSVNKKLPSHGSNRFGITIQVKLMSLDEERVTVYFHSPMDLVVHELVHDNFINMIDALISQ